MKTLKTAIAALLIAGGAIGAFAFTKADSSNLNDKKADPYWFEEGTGAYLGQDTKANIQSNHCGTPGSTLCARAYSDIAGTPGDEVPAGSQLDTASRQ